MGRGGAGSDARSTVLADLAERVRPTVLATERTLPVPEALASLFPLGGVVRGSSLAVQGPGATSLTFALLAGLTRHGHWVATLGVSSWGWAAAAAAGVDLARVIAVAEAPVGQWSTVTAALLDAVDVVAVDPRHQVRATDARRLAARSRERGSVLLRLSVPDGARRFRWPTEPDLCLTTRARWSGLGAGSGRAETLTVAVEPTGRRGRPSSDLEIVLHRGREPQVVSPQPVTPRAVGALRRVV